MSQLVKCPLKGCKKESSVLYQCSSVNCTRQGHVECFSRTVQRLNLDPIDVDGNPHFACTKKCYKVVQAQVTGTKKVTWRNDGPPGKEGVSSETILIDWLTTEGNYRDYCGNNYGKTKMFYGDQLAKKLSHAGITVERTGKNIVDKIYAIENAFKKAHEWIENMGQGMKYTDPDNFWAYVKKVCPYFEELEPIMGDTAGCKPLATTEELEDSTSTEDEQENFWDNNDDDDSSTEENKEQIAEEKEKESTEENKEQIAEEKEKESTIEDQKEEANGEEEQQKERYTSPPSIEKKRKRNSSRGGSSSKKVAGSLSSCNGNLLQHLALMKNKETSSKKSKWSNYEEEDSFKMNTIRRMNELRGMGLSHEEIKQILPRAEPFLKFGKKD